MGLTPILGKGATLAGVNPYSIVAWRTLLAASLLWVVFLIGFRRYLYIFSAGLLGTALVGATNGLGSLLFYNGLLRLDASMAQLLYMLYFVFAMLFTRITGDAISRISLLRAVVAIVAVGLLTGGTDTTPDLQGVSMVIAAALLYALHIILSQRIMYEMPAPTMTIFAMTSMAVVTSVAWLIHGRGPQIVLEPISSQGWVLILGLTAVTALSRLTLFAGVKQLGSIQVVLLNVAEMLAALLLAFIFLDDRLTTIQWVGAALMAVGILLSQWDDELPDAVYNRRPELRILSSRN